LSNGDIRLKRDKYFCNRFSCKIVKAINSIIFSWKYTQNNRLDIGNQDVKIIYESLHIGLSSDFSWSSIEFLKIPPLRSLSDSVVWLSTKWYQTLSDSFVLCRISVKFLYNPIRIYVKSIVLDIFPWKYIRIHRFNSFRRTMILKIFVSFWSDVAIWQTSIC
jgi:hypothetical protein